MLQPRLGPEWKPERAKFALAQTDSGHRLTALVDPGYPTAWRRSPYYEALKRWAAEAAEKFPEVYIVDVSIGMRCIVVLPHMEVDLGILEPDDSIHLSYQTTATGRVIHVSKIK